MVASRRKALDIGLFIKEKRKKYNISIKEMAELLNIDYQSAWRKESGNRRFTLEEILVLSDYLNFSGNELFQALKGNTNGEKET